MALPPFPLPNAAMRAGLALRSGELGFADRLLPAEAALWDFTAGMQRTKLAGVLVDLLMLVECEGGRERSPDQVHDLMRDAGLTPGQLLAEPEEP